MKIEIDLNEVLRDDQGFQCESLEESVRRQVIDRLSGDLRKRMFSQMDRELSDVVNKLIQEIAKEQLPSIMEDIMDKEYTPITNYGSRGEPTTFRKELVKTIVSQMTYKPENYSHNENAFTKAVKSIVELKTKEVQAAITKSVDEKFKQDAISFAVAKLSERLGLPNAPLLK